MIPDPFDPQVEFERIIAEVAGAPQLDEYTMLAGTLDSMLDMDTMVKSGARGMPLFSLAWGFSDATSNYIQGNEYYGTKALAQTLGGVTFGWLAGAGAAALCTTGVGCVPVIAGAALVGGIGGTWLSGEGYDALRTHPRISGFNENAKEITQTYTQEYLRHDINTAIQDGRTSITYPFRGEERTMNLDDLRVFASRNPENHHTRLINELLNK